VQEWGRAMTKLKTLSVLIISLWGIVSLFGLAACRENEQKCCVVENEGQDGVETAVSNNPPVVPAPLPQSPSLMQPVNQDFAETPAYNFAIDDNYTYIASGEEGLNIFDTSDPDNPLPEIWIAVEAWDLMVVENTVYVVGCEKQCVYGVNRISPTEWRFAESYYNESKRLITAMTWMDNHLYVALDNGAIEIVNTSVAPWQLAGYYWVPGAIAAIDSQHDFLYVAVRLKGVYLLDVTNPQAVVEQNFVPAPKPVWHEDAPGQMYDLLADDEYVYVAAGQRGLRVFNHFLESEDRQYIHLYDHYFYHVTGEAIEVEAHADFLYVKSWDEDTGSYYLTILHHRPDDELTRIPLPLVAEYALGDVDPGEMLVWNGRIYFNNGTISQYHPPTDYQTADEIFPIQVTPLITGTEQVDFIGRIGGMQFSFDKQGDYLYLADERMLHIIDVSEPASPKELSRLSFPELIRGVFVHDGFAYMRMQAYEGGYVQLVDISDPLDPVAVDRYQDWVLDIEMETNYFFGLTGYFGPHTSLIVRNVSNPVESQILGIFEKPLRKDAATDNSLVDAIPYRIRDFSLAEDYAYVAWGDSWSCEETSCTGGLAIVDVSDKENLIETGVILHGAPLNTVTVAGDYAFAVDIFGQLLVFDISDKSSPRYSSILEASLTNVFSAQDTLWVDNDTLYAADGVNGLRRFDVGDVTAVTELTSYKTGAETQLVQVDGDFVYLVSQGIGLEILRVDEQNQLQPVYTTQKLLDAADVAVYGDVAYVADEQLGIHVWDISDRLHPIETSLLTDTQFPQKLVLHEDKLFAITDAHMIEWFDLMQPDKPVYKGELPFSAAAITFVNDRAYVTYQNEMAIWTLKDWSLSYRPVN